MRKILPGIILASAIAAGLPERAHNITLHAQAQPDGVVYIHAGALLDRPAQAPRGPSTIVVRNNRIDSIRDGFVAPAPGARLVDLKQDFVLPGLIDAHVHIFSDDDKMRARLELINRDVEDELLIGVDNARRTLEAGFTTVRDLGSDVHSVTALRDAILAGLVSGPTIVAAGPESPGREDMATPPTTRTVTLRRSGAPAQPTCAAARTTAAAPSAIRSRRVPTSSSSRPPAG
jgi:imidazolonepropionase-like amidohydrolase